MDVTDPTHTEALYRAAVGPEKADFYAPKFLRFDQPGASKVSWNWPAFFVAFFWFLYRRMYGTWAIFCLVIPLALGVLGAVSMGLLGRGPGGALYDVAILAYSFAIIPMFANSLYHKAITQRIDTVRQKVPDPATQLTVLENTPHTSHVFWVVLAFFMIAISGILAAIAIPAYQQYTIRAQVNEGLMLAAPLQLAVAERFESTKAWPSDMTEVGHSPTLSGGFVDTLTMDHGTISIRYGNHATTLIAQHVLSLRPTLDGGRIIWTCGYATESAEDPPTGAAGQNVTDVPNTFLPSSCREAAH